MNKLLLLLLAIGCAAVAQTPANQFTVSSARGSCRVQMQANSVVSTCKDRDNTAPGQAPQGVLVLISFDDIACLVFANNTNATSANIALPTAAGPNGAASLGAIGAVAAGTARYSCSVAGVIKTGLVSLAPPPPPAPQK